MSAPPKKIPQPKKSQPSTFMPLLPYPHRPVRLGRQRRDLLVEALRGPAPLDVGVVRLERRPLGADPRDPVEVVPRRRAGRRPLQRAGEAPRVFLGHLLAVAP